MNLFACQLDTLWEVVDVNLKHAREMVEGRSVEENSLIIFPEMFATGFGMEPDKYARHSQTITRFLAEMAADYGCYTLGGVVIGQRNAALIFGPDGSQVARYDKMHPFSPGEEDLHYESGNEVVVARIGDWMIAPFICYDLRFPEVFRQATFKGADLLIVIANWPARRSDHWLTLLRARAIENQAFVVGVNRCGSDPNASYDGNTVIFGPQGEEIAKAASGAALLHANLDRQQLVEWRDSFPVLRDARTDTLP